MKNFVLVIIILTFGMSCTSQSALFDKTEVRQIEGHLTNLQGQWQDDEGELNFDFNVTREGSIHVKQNNKGLTETEYQKLGDLDFILKDIDMDYLFKFKSYDMQTLVFFTNNEDNLPKIFELKRVSTPASTTE